MFRRLRTKLTVLYAALFGLVLLTIAISVSIAANSNAERVVRTELQANGEVFKRLWQMRAEQLHDSADVLARDFGFRSAVATGDAATIGSALDNLRGRLHLDRAFLLTLNGEVIGLDRPLDNETRAALWSALDDQPDSTGVLLVNGEPFEAVAAPVRAPDPIGWIVFAASINRAQLRSFEDLAPIDLTAHAFTRMPHGRWQGRDLARAADLSAFEHLLTDTSASAHVISPSSGEAIAVAVPLPSLLGRNSEAATALVLSYPTELAFAPYRPLLFIVAGLGILGLALVFVGSWFLSRTITKPIQDLDEAANQVQLGRDVHVETKSQDELARLAQSFNTMSAGIKARQAQIRRMALTDPESQLPNRRAFEASLLKRRGVPECPFIVAAIEIDRYDHVRNAIGYKLAGELVRELGLRLTAQFGRGRVARLNSNKLGLILDAGDEREALTRAAGVQRQIEAPLRIGGVAIDVMTTFGVALGDMSASPEELVTRASVAVSQARNAQQSLALFDAEAYGDPSRNLSLISELFAAMHSGDAWLAHQVKYDIRAQTIDSAEALMRWRHPERGMISPDLFVAMAEETGHIRALTDWVIDRAIADQAQLRLEGHDLKVSVNISGRVLGDAGFAQHAIAKIQAANAALCFEITETAVIGNTKQAMATIDQCLAAGVGISIDDYGSGLSSLSYLKQMRAQELKIDKSFVMPLATSQRDALLIKSTIDLAHSLGMKITAEGVEDEATLALLAGMGCDQAQGYLIGRPLPASELGAVLTSNAKGSGQANRAVPRQASR